LLDGEWSTQMRLGVDNDQNRSDERGSCCMHKGQ